jgi:hypothetical protein
MRSWLVAACAVMLASACGSSGASTAGAPTLPEKPDTTMISSTSVVLTAARTTLKCADQLGWPKSPPSSSYTVVLGKVALPTKKAFAAVRLDRTPKSKFWAKQGLLIKPGASFELIVPAAWTSRLTIEWGNPGAATTHLWVTNCRSKKAGAHWLAYAGGFTVNMPACVPLIVKVGDNQRTVHIGVGKACAGQAPPRN